MNTQCSKCGTHLAQPWSFCPHCGLTVTHESHLASGHQTSSIPGAFGGLLCGVIMAPVLIIVGTLLCLTGLGAFLGIPMIIAGLLSPLAGPLLGISEHKGKCPSCGIRVISINDGQTHYCPACDKEFALTDHRLAKAG
jgi:predicted amidophosphoribosyltransferase